MNRILKKKHPVRPLGMRRESAVGVATGYGLDDKRGRSLNPVTVKKFLF
jgi:hypothetical protein